ncbi:oligopeptide/dipeptide ABC transporter ATP-binding protein [Gluconacetobacter tumulicola]|uniref:oligopeptide/dipeptide ABC transporter ATP-binding protein n=1 Tax=Gluconacetobacter tumulicola TaxID=1017177 RepID=UPI003084362B
MADPTAPLLDVRNLTKIYPRRKGLFGKGDDFVALDDISFTVARGEVLGIVGESGSGKSTAGRIAMDILPRTSGQVLFDGVDPDGMDRRQRRAFRRRAQMIFQDPYASLNPRMTVEQLLRTPLALHGLTAGPAEDRRKLVAALDLVGLPETLLNRYPHEFSGGQRQRINIARALMLDPALVVADEAVSALDVSVQAQVVNLFMDLRERLGIAIVFIAHDLPVVGVISDRIAVMYRGRIVELGETVAMFTRPRHPYTAMLLNAAPAPDSAPAGPMAARLPAEETDGAGGCAFRPRCPFAIAACATGKPPVRMLEGGHMTACLRDELVIDGPLAGQSCR